jgi:hypothetical protein
LETVALGVKEDCIVTSESGKRNTVAAYGNRRLLPYTFDTDAGAPLYNASSFILRPPMVDPVAGDDSLAWYIVKVGLLLATDASRSCNSGTLEAAAFGPRVLLSLQGATEGVADSIRRKGNGRGEIGCRLFDRDLAFGAKPHDNAALLINTAFRPIQVGKSGRNVQNLAVESSQGEGKSHAQVLAQLLK